MPIPLISFRFLIKISNTTQSITILKSTDCAEDDISNDSYDMQTPCGDEINCTDHDER